MGVDMMKMKCAVLFLFYVIIASLCVCPQVCAGASPQLGDKTVKEVVSAMTLTEKASLVVGMGMDMSATETAASKEKEAQAANDLRKLVPGAAGVTCPIPRLNISSMVLSDGPAGIRIEPTRKNDNHTYYGTAFPVATLLASTWDTDLVYEAGRAMGNEVLEYGVDILLAPGMNIHRNPLNGRNFEYYSEDPLVTGKVSGAMVKGVQSRGVGATIKHFAANNTETNRMSLDTIISERALREIYLEGFRIAVTEARPWAVMSAYNKINGVYCPQSHDLLTKILRDDWGYRGFVMTDWFGGDDAVAQMKSGNDMIMPGDPDKSAAIEAAVKEGRLDEKILDQNVERILTTLIQSPRFKKYAYSNSPDLKKNADVVRRAAADGMVLLKNKASALPLPGPVKSIAVFGNTSYDIITGGTGSGDVNEAYSVSLVEGLHNAGYTEDKTLNEKYCTYLKTEKAKFPKREMFDPETVIAQMELPAGLIEKSAKENDFAIITIGRNAGEFRDRDKGEGDFELSKAEKSMIENVTHAFHAKGKKCAVILNVGGVVETASWRDIPDAILLAWQGGQECGNSIVDVLSGKVNPSGKLAVTFPMTYSDVPSAKNFPGVVTQPLGEKQKKERTILELLKGEPAEVTYQDGIYVGYRYYDSFHIPTAYEFGYGLSYTNFAYSNLKLSSKTFDKNLMVSIDIQNTGKTGGREVVEVYLSAPHKTLDKPEKELKAFGKTRLLAPGESQTLSFTLDGRSLASYDSAASSWIAEAGTYTVKIGASSSDIRVHGDFTLEKTLVVEKTSKALTPIRSISEIKP
jgi:beta-glucosidase